MNSAPDGEGLFAGQHGYGCRSSIPFVKVGHRSHSFLADTSIEKFVETCQKVNAGNVKLADLDSRLPTIKNTITSTAILEAGRRSLDETRTVGIKQTQEGGWKLV